MIYVVLGRGEKICENHRYGWSMIVLLNIVSALYRYLLLQKLQAFVVHIGGRRRWGFFLNIVIGSVNASCIISHVLSQMFLRPFMPHCLFILLCHLLQRSLHTFHLHTFLI